MKTTTFCSVGDCVVDTYPDEGFARLGGTAFNSALAASDAGAKTSIISAVGDDLFGARYLDVLKNNSVDNSFIRHAHEKTSHISISLNEEGKPSFSSWKLGALNTLSLNEKDRAFISNHSLVRVALFKSFERVFEQVYAMKLSQTIKLADFSGGSMYSNEKEIVEKYIDGFDVVLKSIEDFNAASLSYYEALAQKTSRIIIITAGQRGSITFVKGQKFEVPVKEVVRTNSTGSGDVYFANFSIRYLQSQNIRHAMEYATERVRIFLKEDKYRYTYPL